MTRAMTYCETLVREADKDRWLTSLFVPEPQRSDLLALYAFNIEIARVREVVSNPMPGEIRLQWWRDLLAGGCQKAASGHPAAQPLLAAIERSGLPHSAFDNMIEARVFDLYDDPMPTMQDLIGYCGETSSAIIRLASLMLARGKDPDTADVAGHSGVAYAITGLLRCFPLHASRGQLYLPLEILDQHGVRPADIFRGHASPQLRALLAHMRQVAREHLDKAAADIARLPAEVVPAFLPVCLVRGYLARMERRDYDPFTTIVNLPQWQRQWVIWRSFRRANRLCACSRPIGEVQASGQNRDHHRL